MYIYKSSVQLVAIKSRGIDNVSIWHLVISIMGNYISTCNSLNILKQIMRIGIKGTHCFFSQYNDVGKIY